MCCRLVSSHRGSHWADHCPVPAADIFRPSLLNYEFNLLYSNVKCYYSYVVSKNKFVKMLQVNFICNWLYWKNKYSRWTLCSTWRKIQFGLSFKVESGGAYLACESQCTCLTNIAVVTEHWCYRLSSFTYKSISFACVFFNIIEITIAREVREILPAVIGMPTVAVGGAISFPNAALI